MDYTQIPAGESGGIYAEEEVTLPLRSLTEAQARQAVAPWLTGSKPGFKSLKLFGPGAAHSWTVAVMSDLKDMAYEIRRGTLGWILQRRHDDQFVEIMNKCLPRWRILRAELNGLPLAHEVWRE